ncbi:hypothetical protein Agabi119p4_5089 [Agaricus bisporus var. burnettii]|uniref:Uncharacterized protein n=1 Tax=Agaricus bisporus var. burnettii TaxID=192524 RepID=A0A8H7F4J4_AGABI|nr:hypothetical protein Agabi119p4_5089 [Agaricus bisporus var. burnettii]
MPNAHNLLCLVLYTLPKKAVEGKSISMASPRYYSSSVIYPHPLESLKHPHNACRENYLHQVWPNIRRLSLLYHKSVLVKLSWVLVMGSGV